MFIEMTEFPYVSKQEVLDSKGKHFCKVKAAIKGDVNDSFDGYIISNCEIDGHGVKVPQGKPYLSLQRISDESHLLMGIQPNPQAQMIHYQKPGGPVLCVKPYDFLKLLEKEAGIKMPSVKKLKIEGEALESEQTEPENPHPDIDQELCAKWGFTVEDAVYVKTEFLQGTKVTEIAKEFDGVSPQKLGQFISQVLKLKKE